MTRSLAHALASRTSGATDSTNAGPVSQRANVRRSGVTFAGANALRRAASSCKTRHFRPKPKRRHRISCANQRKVMCGAYKQRRITTPAPLPVNGLCIRDSAVIRRTNRRLRRATRRYRRPGGRGGPHLPHLQIIVEYRQTGTDTAT
jgi:hypothetical protein